MNKDIEKERYKEYAEYKERCEWQLLINGELKTSCGHWIENYPEEGICPYCHKPIRVGYLFA